MSMYHIDPKRCSEHNRPTHTAERPTSRSGRTTKRSKTVLCMSHLYFFYLSRFGCHVSVVLRHHRRQLHFHLGLLLAGRRLLLLVQLRRLPGLLCKALNALRQRSTLLDKEHNAGGAVVCGGARWAGDTVWTCIQDFPRIIRCVPSSWHLQVCRGGAQIDTTYGLGTRHVSPTAPGLAPTPNLPRKSCPRVAIYLTPEAEHTIALLCRTFFSWSSFAFATASAAFVLMESISTALVCVTSWSSSLRFFIVAPNAPTSWCCSTKP